jgi:hypothetical protein
MPWTQWEEYHCPFASPPSLEVIPAFVVVIQIDYRIVARKPTQVVWGMKDGPFIVEESLQAWAGREYSLHGE